MTLSRVTTTAPLPSTAVLAATVDACRGQIASRFPEPSDRGAAAMLLADGTVLTGTAPDAHNASVEVCHETGPYCEAFRLDQRIVASVCLHRTPEGDHIVLSPCGVCMERLAVHGGDVLVGVPESGAADLVEWVSLREAHPHYWMKVFPDELQGW